MRGLAGINNGRISLNDLKGKKSPWFKDIVDYYFETREDFDNRIQQIIAENNGELINKTFGFGDNFKIVQGFTNALFKRIKSTPKAIYSNISSSFNYIFFGCESLTTISKSLFDNCPNVSEFRECFARCTSLATIPQGLFDNCHNVKGFANCFSECTSLTSIPKGLFDNCNNVKTFYYCFSECTSLTIIPKNLFDNCRNVTQFAGCFYSDIKITSALPDAWNKEKFPKVNSYKSYAYNCTGASNYAETPTDWKNNN